MMSTEKKFSQLIVQNPNLPILPVIEDVDGETSVRRIGESRLDEYVVIYLDGEAHIFTRADEGKLEEIFADMMTPQCRKPSEEETYEIVQKAYAEVERLPWRQAIFVNIN